MAEDMNDAFEKRFEKLSEELADNSKNADRVAENVSNVIQTFMSHLVTPSSLHCISQSSWKVTKHTV